MKLISGERDNTVPWALTNAAFKRQRRNPTVTEIQETLDAGTRSSSTPAGRTSRARRCR